MNEPIRDLLARAAGLARQGRRCTLCLVVGSRGSTPQAPGALMLVDDAAMTYGTIGGGCVEAEVRRRAFEMARERRTGVLRFKLDHDYGWDDGLICGGTLDIAVAAPPGVERLEAIVAALDAGVGAALEVDVEAGPGRHRYVLHLPARDRLLIAGAGHVGQALARLALRLDFEVTVFDDRDDLLRTLMPEGCRAVTGHVADRLRAEPLDERAYCVIVTRGHRHDEQALAAVVGRGARYIGMIGSRRKVKLIFDDLRALGVDAAQLELVRAPIGIDIGSVTVEEIALSIAAELVRERRQRGQKLVDGPLAIRGASEEPARAELASSSLHPPEAGR